MKKEFQDIKDEAKSKLTEEDYNLLKSRLDKLERRFDEIERVC